MLKVFGVETSCDETALAVLAGHRVLSSKVASQIDLHRIFGGVLPEASSRRHLEVIYSLYKEVVSEAGDDFDLVAATFSPGLHPALLIGASFARAFATSRGIPLVAVDHVIAHVWVGRLAYPDLRPPFLGLVISGGHTALMMVEDVDRVRLVADTRDDAMGEMQDKVGRHMGIPYPAGPVLDKMALEWAGEYPSFPIPRFKDGSLDFSFSGLKTAAMRAYDSGWAREAVARGIYEAATAQLVDRIRRAVKTYGRYPLVVGGGVAASSFLRQRLSGMGLDVYFVPRQWCTDNAVMIAFTGLSLYEKGLVADVDTDVLPQGVLWSG